MTWHVLSTTPIMNMHFFRRDRPFLISSYLCTRIVVCTRIASPFVPTLSSTCVVWSPSCPPNPPNKNPRVHRHSHACHLSHTHNPQNIPQKNPKKTERSCAFPYGFSSRNGHSPALSWSHMAVTEMSRGRKKGKDTWQAVRLGCVARSSRGHGQIEEEWKLRDD